jgi:hypothetical protein
MENWAKSNKELMRTSKQFLVFLAGAVWYMGAIMLFRSGLELIYQARNIQPAAIWQWLAIIVGIGLGIFQAMTIFSRSCRRNIQRIYRLKDPKLWQFFRPGFFLALAVMITSGILLDHFARGHYFFMLGVAALDFALTVSLLGSSYIFWKDKQKLLEE